LAHTVKGWTLGPDVEGRNSTHQIKKLDRENVARVRERLHLQDLIPDSALEGDDPPYVRFATDSPEYEYLMQRRRALDGSLPKRVNRSKPLVTPTVESAVFNEFDGGSRGVSVSTTMVFARMIRSLLRDETIGKMIVPIIPDEARTFGMDGLFKEVKIYAPFGQKYDPRRRHYRIGRHGVVHGRRNFLRHPWHANDSDVHFLFDVRIPAHR
jgi:pyruvate dehydrogenase E1 component